MNGTVNPNGADTTVYFQYGLTTAYGNNTGTADFGSGTTTLSGSSTLSGLTPNTTYHYQFVAYNSGGTRYGGDVPFTTSSAAPAPSISSVNPASPIGSNSTQPFTIYGNNFVSGCNVTLRVGSSVYANRTISSFSSTAITINPDFTTVAQTWTVQVINPDGQSSSQFSFNVIAPTPSGILGADFDADGYTINWSQEISSSPSFLIIKATQGNNPNSFLPSNMSGAPAITSGFTFGLYDYADPDEYENPSSKVTDPSNASAVIADAQAAANSYYQTAESYLTAGHLVPALDVEDEEGYGGFNSPYDSISGYPKWSWSEIAEWIAAWTTQLQQDDPSLPAPILYMTQGYAQNISPQLINSYLSSSISYPLWVVDINDSPTVDPSPTIGSWPSWAIEQYDWPGTTPPGDLDALNSSTTLSSLEIEMDTTPPALTIASPVNGAVVTSASLPVSGTASDNGYGNNGISSVTVNGASASGGSASGTATANWSATVTLVSGLNTITVVAKDTLNNSTQKVVSVTYNPPDTTAPTVTISSPASGTTYTTAQTVVILASASDNVGVTKVDFYDGTSLIDSVPTAPYAHGWAITSANNGTHNWTARAYDAAGNVNTSSVVSLTVNIDTTPPALTIISPVNGAVVTSASMPVSGTASDSGLGNNGVSSVTVNGISASGGTASGTATANWSATVTLVSGANTVTVVAKDTLNNSTQKVVTVTYNPPRPVFGGLSISGGQLQTTLSGLSTGEKVVLYGSTDLKTWTPIQTNTVSGSTLPITGAINPGMKAQYFRIMVQ